MDIENISTKNLHLITVFAPPPSENLVVIDGVSYLQTRDVLYSAKVLRETCLLLESGADLMDFGGYHKKDVNALIGKTCGKTHTPVWEQSNFQVICFVNLTDYGQRLYESKVSPERPVFLSPSFYVAFEPKKASNGLNIAQRITEIYSIDFNNAPLTGARFGRLDKRNFNLNRQKITQRTR